MSSNPDPIDPLLNRWRDVRLPVPQRDVLATEVWRRIADAESSFESSLFGRIEAAFSRPSFAFAFVAACTLFGLFLAEVRVSRIQAQRNVQLAQAYIQLIDPLLEQSGGASSGTNASILR